MGAFKNKRLNILLIMPSFYNISKVIENELLKRGHEVTFIENKILKEDYHLLKTVMSFIYFLLNPFYKTSYTNQILKKIHKKSFDLLFVVGHLSTNHNLFKHLKKLNLNIKTVLYLWDSFSVWDFSHLLEKFDYKYSFDRMDCKKHTSMNLVYFPLFYDFKDEQNNNNILYDITHIGTLNKHYNIRLKIIATVISQAKVLGLRTYIRTYAYSLNSSFFKRKKTLAFLRDRLVYLFDLKFRNHIILLRKYKDRDFIFDSGLSQDMFNKIEGQSKCLLDINLSMNTGVSHRLVRAVAMGKKVITTNKHIINEDFYKPNNIFIMDIENPIVDIHFINSPIEKVDISNLRIDNWINKIFVDIGLSN